MVLKKRRGKKKTFLPLFHLSYNCIFSQRLLEPFFLPTKALQGGECQTHFLLLLRQMNFRGGEIPPEWMERESLNFSGFHRGPLVRERSWKGGGQQMWEVYFASFICSPTHLSYRNHPHIRNNVLWGWKKCYTNALNFRGTVPYRSIKCQFMSKVFTKLSIF